MATWVRRSFDSAGITQAPAGPALPAVQRRHASGTVMLLIDVSGSMQGERLAQAVVGARQFVDEAVEAGYAVGIVLWHTSVAAIRLPDTDPKETRALLAQASFPSGGTNLYPALERTNEVLQEYTGDRVVAIFGDGDLGSPARVHPLVARMKADDIRFVTRGLGAVAATEFGKISDEAPEHVRVDNEAHLAESIASMARSLKAN